MVQFGTLLYHISIGAARQNIYYIWNLLVMAKVKSNRQQGGITAGKVNAKNINIDNNKTQVMKKNSSTNKIIIFLGVISSIITVGVFIFDGFTKLWQ
ncbi:hypothetical protein CKQ54_21850 [Rahnella variigena]|uniref:Uncharacterized protein n=2 Tax=Gammaproteobacteria TaxID=1236 RepID=A0ABX9PPI3_9GAMM|nr:hypothetical protein D6D38_21900 [Rahnella variigena]RKF66890.1 hypothetical protein CKQ54_00095 [Rahnella variigena]RKF70839.1 hypothetical protein CKQ54_21850 [Rahnella variigena]